MALLDPSQLTPSKLHEVLKREAPTPRSGPDGNRRDLNRLLENANLTAPEVLDNLSSLMRSAETDSVRAKACETALKLNGLLDADKAKSDFSVTINILNGDFDINPILIPR